MPKNSANGIIVRVAGPVVDARFEGDVPTVNEALVVDLPGKTELVLEVAFIMGDGEVKTLALGPTDGLSRGMSVRRTNSSIKVPVGMPTLGRIFNVLGQPIDGAGKLVEKGKDKLSLEPIHKMAPPLTEQETKPQILETGIKVIDLIAPFTKGGKIAAFGGAGERSREGNDLWLEMTKNKTMEKTIMVFGQMNEPPANRLRVALTALTMAEYFRDQRKEDVLLFIDNVFRFAQAGSEV